MNDTTSLTLLLKMRRRKVKWLIAIGMRWSKQEGRQQERKRSSLCWTQKKSFELVQELSIEEAYYP